MPVPVNWASKLAHGTSATVTVYALKGQSIYVILGGITGSGVTLSISDSAGTTYSIAESADSVGEAELVMWYADKVVAGPHTITAGDSTNGGDQALVVLVVGQVQYGGLGSIDVRGISGPGNYSATSYNLNLPGSGGNVPNLHASDLFIHAAVIQNVNAAVSNASGSGFPNKIILSIVTGELNGWFALCVGWVACTNAPTVGFSAPGSTYGTQGYIGPGLGTNGPSYSFLSGGLAGAGGPTFGEPDEYESNPEVPEPDKRLGAEEFARGLDR
jgi:hypothetical protein